jgi:hypothetical protein
MILITSRNMQPNTKQTFHKCKVSENNNNLSIRWRRFNKLINPLKPEAYLNNIISPYLKKDTTRFHDNDQLVNTLFKEIIAVYSKDHKKHTVTLWTKCRVRLLK